MKFFLGSLLAVMFLAACQTGDGSEVSAGDILIGEVFIDSNEIVVSKDVPTQVSLSLQGSLPTPCHTFRADVTPADAEGNVYVKAYSLYDSQQICAQVLQDFQESVLLGSFEDGVYKVFVNDQEVQDFTLP